jgi:thioredoxin 1
MSTAMASKNVKEFQDVTFDAEVLKSDLPVLVDFWAPWCAPCRMIAPSVEALASEYEGKAKFGKVNIDEHPSIAQRYHIHSIPTVLLFKGGEPVNQAIGAVPKRHLEEMLKQAL